MGPPATGDRDSAPASVRRSRLAEARDRNCPRRRSLAPALECRRGNADQRLLRLQPGEQAFPSQFGRERGTALLFPAAALLLGAQRNLAERASRENERNSF